MFESDCMYNVMLCRDFLNKVGMHLMYDNGMMEWLGRSIPMHAPFTKNDDYLAILDDCLLQKWRESLSERTG